MYADLISGDRHLSGVDLERRAKTVAGGLAASDLGPGDVINVLMRNDFPFLEVALGASRAGVAMVPLNWHASNEELMYILSDSGGKVLFAHADLFERVRDHLPTACKVIIVDVPADLASAYKLHDVPTSAATGHCEYEDWLSKAPNDVAKPSSPPFRLMYTSGSTGVPKGVIRGRGTDEIADRIARSAFEVHGGGADRWRAIMANPLYHSAPLAFSLTYIRYGELLVLQSKFDPVEFLRLIEKHSVSHVYAVSTMFNRLLTLPLEARGTFDRSSLKSVAHSAAMCAPETKRAMIEWWGPIINEAYAATETGIIAQSTSEEWLARPGTVGRAVEGVKVRIVDEEGHVLPAGELGEIQILSDLVPFIQYRNRPEALEELRRGDWITMGDVGRMDEDGFLWIEDRKKDLVISGGVNIFPAEVERVLIALPGVRDCVVFGIPDEDMGESLGALVELRGDATISEADVKSYLQERLGRMRTPKAVRFLKTLPREDTGKLARRKARAAFLGQ